MPPGGAPAGLARRAVLTGLAALPAAGLPIAGLSASSADPFIGYDAKILAVQDVLNGDCSPSEEQRLAARWSEIDGLVLAGQPTTLAGALGALDYARREYVQFQLCEREDTDDPSERLVLHLLDGARAVLRQVAGGGRA